jgi:Formiminotransferase-cyclodeaminase
MHRQIMSDTHLIFAEEALPDFVRDLASTKIAPGSGAAAAIVLGLAASCAAKAFAISARHCTQACLDTVADQAREIAMAALQGAQRDAEDFGAWVRGRAATAAAALEDDARILFRISCELEKIIDTNRKYVFETLSADIAAAQDFVSAFKAVECRNIDELRG